MAFRHPRPAQWGLAFAEDHAVIVRDRFDEIGGGCLTITNGAEGVVEELAPMLAGRRLFYVDTEGRVDELLVKDGRFAGFKAGYPSLEAAVAALRT